MYLIKDQFCDESEGNFVLFERFLNAFIADVRQVVLKERANNERMDGGYILCRREKDGD